MTFKLKILGSNSAAPAHNRHQSAQLLQIENQFILIDCGEGTQMQLKKYRAKARKISHIFISHLHGDHYLGLVGLLSTMHLQGRKQDLHLYGPAPLAEIITVHLRHSEMYFNYKVHFHALDLDKKELIMETNTLEVHAFPLQHRITCHGFIFQEKPKPYRINKSVMPVNMKLEHIMKLKKGEDVYDEKGELLYNASEMTFPPRRSRSYAYCSDTIFDPTLPLYFKGVDLLYHEATFLKDQASRASDTFHSTAEQAAMIAKDAEAGQLLLGHFSIRYKDLSPILSEAKEVFRASRLALEGETITIDD
ncbi:ribonuclease Z [Roseivirga sp. BDSF3-8]|uniref:ribonuclease Z n=1 Tax=Roseivirga sp. BDSF3-8 TaxID=3241598 RepID=UPI00353245FA